MTDTPALIDLSGVTKVFLTDEVETHAVHRHLLHDPLLSVDTALRGHVPFAEGASLHSTAARAISSVG